MPRFHTCLQAVSRRLVQLAGEVAAAQQRSKAASSSGAPRAAAAKPGKAGGIGSVEHTLKVRAGTAVLQAGGWQRASWIAALLGAPLHNQLPRRWPALQRHLLCLNSAAVV